MTVLVTFRSTRDSDGEVMFDETVPAEHAMVWALEKQFEVLGVSYTLRIEFDPPAHFPPGPS